MLAEGNQQRFYFRVVGNIKIQLSIRIPLLYKVSTRKIESTCKLEYENLVEIAMRLYNSKGYQYKVTFC